MNRREFVQSLAGAGALAGGIPLAAASAAGEPAGRFSTLKDAHAAAGFDPRAAGSFTVAWAADVHYGVGAGEQILPPLVREVNALNPPPAFFGIAGDLIL